MTLVLRDYLPAASLDRTSTITVVFPWFVRKRTPILQVVKHMVHGDPCVTITGQKGIGKTQVLLKACAYTRERNVFGEIFFCRLDRAGGGNDACNWLEVSRTSIAFARFLCYVNVLDRTRIRGKVGLWIESAYPPPLFFFLIYFIYRGGRPWR